MKVKIIDYFWAVGHRTKRKGAYRLPLIEGCLKKIGYLTFKIERVEGDKAIVAVCREDGTQIKTLTVEKGVGNYYRPMSMDAGHEYVLKMTKLF